MRKLRVAWNTDTDVSNVTEEAESPGSNKQIFRDEAEADTGDMADTAWARWSATRGSGKVRD